MAKIVYRWTHKNLVKMMDTWALHVQDLLDTKAKLRRIMGHWTHRALATPFDTWITRVAEKKQMSSRAKNIILRMLNR